MVDAENILQVEGPCESDGLGHITGYLEGHKFNEHAELVDELKLEGTQQQKDREYVLWQEKHAAILEKPKDYKDVWWDSLVANDPTEVRDYPGDDAIPDLWGPTERDETGRDRVNASKARAAKFGWRTAEVLRHDDHEDIDIRLLEDAFRRDIICGKRDWTRVGVELPVAKTMLRNVPPDWILEYLELHKPDMLVTQTEKDEKAKADIKASAKQKATKKEPTKRERRMDSYIESKNKQQSVFFETMKKDIQRLAAND